MQTIAKAQTREILIVRYDGISSIVRIVNPLDVNKEWNYSVGENPKLQLQCWPSFTLSHVCVPFVRYGTKGRHKVMILSVVVYKKADSLS